MYRFGWAVGTDNSSSIRGGSRTPHYLGWRQWHPQSNQDLTIVKGFLGSLLVCGSDWSSFPTAGTHPQLEDSANGLVKPISCLVSKC